MNTPTVPMVQVTARPPYHSSVYHTYAQRYIRCATPCGQGFCQQQFMPYFGTLFDPTSEYNFCNFLLFVIDL